MAAQSQNATDAMFMTILETLGEGSFGKVYKARRKFTGQAR